MITEKYHVKVSVPRIICTNLYNKLMDVHPTASIFHPCLSERESYIEAYCPTAREALLVEAKFMALVGFEYVQ